VGWIVGIEVAVERDRPKGLDELYATHIDDAVRLAYLIVGDEYQAQDIAQEAFVKLAGRFRGLRDPNAFPAYMRATIVNLSRGHLRRLRTQRAHLERRTVEPAPVTADPETRDELWRALARLPHRQRVAIVLRYYEDLSERQTADAMGCSVTAVKSLVLRGMTELRSEVRRQDHE
jgi:RNA polymerase sigma-70 factor (sigma-E family)